MLTPNNLTGNPEFGKFTSTHGGFRFIEEETFIDEKEHKALFRWQLEWPSPEKGCERKPEKRRGVDGLHFQDGKIIKKLTYSKTTVEIDEEKFPSSYLKKMTPFRLILFWGEHRFSFLPKCL